MEAVQDGDRNTHFFHTSTAIRHKFSHIETLQDMEVQWITNLEAIGDMVREFFKGLYVEMPPQEVEQGLNRGLFPHLTTKQVQDLSEPFTTQHVSKALKAMSALKSPGPYGYPAYFFQ